MVLRKQEQGTITQYLNSKANDTQKAQKHS